MNHNGITSNCASCHGGQFPGVPKKPSDHPQTTADCSQCHNTNDFDAVATPTKSKVVPDTKRALGLANAAVVGAATSGTRVPGAAAAAIASKPEGSADGGALVGPRARATNHATVVPGMCATCHNGAGATGRPAKHLATLLSCDSCHRTTAWIPANFTHTGIAAGGCATCHNGTGAAGKPASHFTTVRTCDSCHRVTAWRPILPYRHVSPLYSMHSPGVTCVACHAGNGEMVTMRYPNLRSECGSCHGPEFRSGRPRPSPMAPKPGSPQHAP